MPWRPTPRYAPVLITGTAERFCAGADLTVMQDLSRANHRLVQRGIEVQAGLEALEKPVVAAIAGYALGGGFELALSCDIRVAGSATRVGLPEIRLGLFPARPGTQRLTRLVGPSRALQMIMDGEQFRGAEAVQAGLAHEVVDEAEVLLAAMSPARRLAQGPTRAYGLLKRAVFRGMGAAARPGAGGRTGRRLRAHRLGGRPGGHRRVPAEAPAQLHRTLTRRSAQFGEPAGHCRRVPRPPERDHQRQPRLPGGQVTA